MRHIFCDECAKRTPLLACHILIGLHWNDIKISRWRIANNVPPMQLLMMSVFFVGVVLLLFYHESCKCSTYPMVIERIYMECISSSQPNGKYQPFPLLSYLAVCLRWFYHHILSVSYISFESRDRFHNYCGDLWCLQIIRHIMNCRSNYLLVFHTLIIINMQTYLRH